MSSSQIPETPKEPLNFPESVTPSQESLEILKYEQEEDKPNSEVEGEGEGEAEEGECGFCLFMKGGECKDVFIAWEKCIEEGEKEKEDIVNKCFEVTSALKNCMEAHPDYYEPILRAEKAAEAELAEELEKDKEKQSLESSQDSKQSHDPDRS